MHTGLLMERAERKRLHGRLRCRWKDNINLYIQENLVARTGLIGLMMGTGDGHL